MASPRRQQKKSRTQAVREARAAAARRQRRNKAVALAVVIALLVGSITTLSLVNGNDSNSSKTSTSTTATTAVAPRADALAEGESLKGDTPCPAADGTAKRTTKFEKAPSMCIDVNKTYVANFDTSEGKLAVELDSKVTPHVTNNFVVLSRYHYYDGTALFRTNTSIGIIQGGAPSQTNSDQGPGYNIADEGTPFTYADGDLIMANTGQPGTSGAQFFFGASPKVSSLPGTYLKFGKTTEGLDVLHKILSLHVDTESSGEGAPSKVVTINKVTITEK